MEIDEEENIYDKNGVIKNMVENCNFITKEKKVEDLLNPIHILITFDNSQYKLFKIVFTQLWKTLTMTEKELLDELVDLTDITYLMYSFYSYIDLNVQAVQEILKYFDNHFQIINHNICMNKLYFKKYLTKKESDLKYILSFKIIIESCALIESYYHEIIKINNSAEIKAQKKELKEVLSYLNEKNTDRVNDEIHEVYLKQRDIHYNNIIKQRKNVDIDIQNSFCIDVHQQEDFYKRLGEKQYDEEIQIRTTRKNIHGISPRKKCVECIA